MNLAIRRVTPALGLAALVFAAYWPARHGGFIWDDWQFYIVNNSLLRLPDGLYRFWFTTEPYDYYPLAIVLWRFLRAMNVPAAWFE